MMYSSKRRAMALFTRFILLLFGMLGSFATSAEPRALIVGIGHYLAPGQELPGSAEDVESMRDLAKIMGFKSHQVRYLHDDEATYQRVVGEMSTWLREGVEANDPVLFYFSGHGTRLTDHDKDESDPADEALVMHDSILSRESGASNFLVDDQIAQLVEKIPSQRVLLLLDACHSGTATRTLDLSQFQLGTKTAFRKFYSYEGMPNGGSIAIDDEAGAPSNFAALAAAGDQESAIATPAGGVFTLGLVEAIKSAAQARKEISIEQLRSQVDAYIGAHVEPARRYHPATSGRPELIASPLSLVPLENGNGPAWEELQALAARGETLKINASKAIYQVDEEVQLTIDSPRPGYLNLITVDSTDNTTVLFPNSSTPDNHIGAGRLVFPTSDMPFTLPAMEPLGKTLVVAFLSDTPVNALELGIEGRDTTGRFTETFTEVTMMAQRAIGIAQRSGRFSAGALEVMVVPRN